MFPRVLAAFLALTLLWSAFAGLERQLPDAAAPELAQASAPHAGGALPAGSIDEHHLDDRPGQPPAEPGDQVAAAPMACRVPAGTVAAAPSFEPHTPVAMGLPERPLRPPQA